MANPAFDVTNEIKGIQDDEQAIKFLSGKRGGKY